MTQYQKLLQIIEDAQPDYDAFYDKGNKAAGIRVRKALQEVKRLAQDMRVHIQETKNLL